MTEKKKRGRPRKNAPKQIKRTQIIPWRTKDGWLWREVEAVRKSGSGNIEYIYPLKRLIFCPETNGLRALEICNKCELRSKKKSKKGVVCWPQSTTQPPEYYNRFNPHHYGVTKPTNNK